MRRIGVTIASVMAVAWCAIGMGCGPGVSVAPLAAAAAISALLITLAWRNISDPPRTDAQRRRTGTYVLGASTAEGLAIPIAYNVLLNTGLGSYFICAFAAIVGLHFIPLSYGLRNRTYLGVAAGMVAVAVAGCFVMDANLRAQLVGYGCALVLWGATVQMLPLSVRVARG